MVGYATAMIEPIISVKYFKNPEYYFYCPHSHIICINI